MRTLSRPKSPERTVAPVVPVASGLRLVDASCCICETDRAMPVAVGEDFEYRTSGDSFLAVRCEGCGLVYLDPRPADDDLGLVETPCGQAKDARNARRGALITVSQAIARRRVRTWLAGVAPDATIVVVTGDANDHHPAAVRAAGFRDVASAHVVRGRVSLEGFAPGSIDAAIVFRALEKTSRPLDVLTTLGRSLRPGGRLVVVTENTGSFDRRLFAGRHWGGYRFPRHPALFDRPCLERLAARAGLRVRAARTIASPVNWMASLRNTFVDYGAPRALVGFVGPRSPVALAAFTAVDAGLARLGGGALLCAVLDRP